MERTKDAKIRACLRQLWLRSKERATAMKNNNYTCQKCGVKKSVAKGREQRIEVHHKRGILNWQELIKQIRLFLLCNPEDLEVLCPECHKLETEKQLLKIQ
jgi:predicted HNH restriction endonuclease